MENTENREEEIEKKFLNRKANGTAIASIVVQRLSLFIIKLI